MNEDVLIVSYDKGYGGEIPILLVSRKTDKGIELDIYIIICYGVKVIDVVKEVQQKVKYELENALDVDFAAINVFVQGVKVID